MLPTLAVPPDSAGRDRDNDGPMGAYSRGKPTPEPLKIADYQGF